MRRVTINTSPRSARSPTNSNVNPSSAPDSLRASVTSMDPSILASSNRVGDQQKMGNNVLGSYSAALNTSSAAKASKLLKSSTGDSASGRGAFSFEKMWRERVGGDAILSSITSNSAAAASSSSSATRENNYNSPTKNISNNQESMMTKQQQQQTQQRRFATAPSVSGVFIQDAGSAFLGIPDSILSSVERSAVNAQFSSSEGNVNGSLVVPRDLTKIRVGLSTALRVSVGIPDDIMYDLLVIGKTGVCLLKVMQQQKSNDEVENNDERNNKNNAYNADDDFSIMMDPRTNRNRGKNNSINSGELDDKKKSTASSSSTLSSIKQVEVSMQALLDVAKWIKYQMDSDKHPIDAAAEDSPHRERLECLNSEVADSLSLFEAASTSHNHLANVSTTTNNSNNNNAGNLATATATTPIATTMTAQFRLTPRAALASVRCEPPAPAAATSSSQNKKKKKENDNRRKSLASRSDVNDDNDGEKDGDENSSKKKKKSGKDKSKGENSSDDESSGSSSDDDDSSSDSSDGENGKKSSGTKKNRKNHLSSTKKSGGSSSGKSEENASDRASNNNNNNNRKRSPSSAGQQNDNNNSKFNIINKKKPKAPEVEARKEFKKFMARDPWRQTAAALFASLGGDVFESINGSLPFPVVERVVRLTLHRRIEHAAVEGAVLFLSSKYEGRRLTLVDFDFDVVRPLARLLGCDSGSGGGAQNGNQGDIGISSQIRAAQHVIKLFMTPASKLARDEAARFRGKRNFKDSEELLLAAKFSIERVKNRLSELRIIDPHVEKIFKNSCILEGTGLTHILDLSRFALQDFVQKVKDNRPIAVNPAMVLRRKIVDRFINVVERAARTLYDHSSACARCKKIAEVIRNHINEQRQKDSTFHQQYYERQKSMMLSSKYGKNGEKNSKKKKKKRKQRKITSDASFESLIEMHESDSDDEESDDEENDEEEEKEQEGQEDGSKSSSSSGIASSLSADAHDLSNGGSKNDSVPLVHIKKSHSHHRNGDQSDEEHSTHIANLSVATAKFAASSATAGAGSVTSRPLALVSLVVSPNVNQSFSGGAESKKRPVVVSFDAERQRRSSAIVIESSDIDDNNDSSDFSSLSDNPQTEQPSSSSAKTKLEKEKKKKHHDKKKNQGELSSFEPLLVSTETIRNTSFGAHFASDEFSASGEGSSDLEEKSKSRPKITCNNPVLLIPKPPCTSNSKSEQKEKVDDRKKQVRISEGKTAVSLEKNAGGKNNSKRPSTSSSATSSHQHQHHVCRPPPKAELYVKPTDSIHEQRLRSGQIREIFRMIQMKDATCGKLGAIREQEAKEKSGDRIGPGWQ